MTMTMRKNIDHGCRHQMHRRRAQGRVHVRQLPRRAAATPMEDILLLRPPKCPPASRDHSLVRVHNSAPSSRRSHTILQEEYSFTDPVRGQQYQDPFASKPSGADAPGYTCCLALWPLQSLAPQLLDGGKSSTPSPASGFIHLKVKIVFTEILLQDFHCLSKHCHSCRPFHLQQGLGRNQQNATIEISAEEAIER